MNGVARPWLKIVKLDPDVIGSRRKAMQKKLRQYAPVAAEILAAESNNFGATFYKNDVSYWRLRPCDGHKIYISSDGFLWEEETINIGVFKSKKVCLEIRLNRLDWNKISCPEIVLRRLETLVELHSLIYKFCLEKGTAL